jgi:hypothetical protein
MYISNIDTYIIENPKCASRTIAHTVNDIFEEKDISLEGHIFFDEVIEKIPASAKIYGIVRNPIDRLISGIRYWCDTIEKVDYHLEQLVKGLVKNKRSAPYMLYEPQSTYVKEHPRVKIYTFEDLNVFLKELGWRKEIKKFNQGHYEISKEEIKNRALFDKVLSKYFFDFNLYDRVMGMRSLQNA